MAFSYAVFMDVEGRRCVVIGGGRAGAEKARGLVAAGAEVHVVDPVPCVELEDLAAGGSIELHRRPYSPSDLDGASLVVCATDDPAVNDHVCAEARARGVLVNHPARPHEGDFVLPSTIRRGGLTIAVATGGRSPVLAKLLRERLEIEFDRVWSDVVEIAARTRTLTKHLTPQERLRRWRAALGSQTLALLRRGEERRAHTHVEGVLRGSARGLVSLVGAGPGDPELLTLAGKDRLMRADVVFYDRLVHPGILQLAPSTTERIYIGKAHGQHTLEQEQLNDLLIERARRGERVVRLKGGDPFLFGRGGEEASALARAGVPFEVVPGISSALAVPAQAGIPVTDRRFGSSVAIVTGHRAPDDPGSCVDWWGLARSVDTIVILMGVRQLPAIVDVLIRAGRPADTPAAVIQWGTYEHQRSVVADLQSLPTRVREEGIGPPAVIVIGEVVSLHAALGARNDTCRALSRAVLDVVSVLSPRASVGDLGTVVATQMGSDRAHLDP